MEQTNKSLEQMVLIDEGHLFDDYYNGVNFNSLEPTYYHIIHANKRYQKLKLKLTKNWIKSHQFLSFKKQLNFIVSKLSRLYKQIVQELKKM